MKNNKIKKLWQWRLTKKHTYAQLRLTRVYFSIEFINCLNGFAAVFFWPKKRHRAPGFVKKVECIVILISFHTFSFCGVTNETNWNYLSKKKIKEFEYNSRKKYAYSYSEVAELRLLSPNSSKTIFFLKLDSFLSTELFIDNLE